MKIKCKQVGGGFQSISLGGLRGAGRASFRFPPEALCSHIRVTSTKAEDDMLERMAALQAQVEELRAVQSRERRANTLAMQRLVASEAALEAEREMRTGLERSLGEVLDENTRLQDLMRQAAPPLLHSSTSTSDSPSEMDEGTP